MNITRREWGLAAACWAEILRAQPAPSNQFVWFNAADAGEIKTIADQIIPADGGPGAESANVILFIDRSLAGFDQDKQQLYRTGLAQTQAKRAEMFPGSTSITSLSDDQKIALLKAIEKTDFFQQVRQHTILGFFGQPEGIKFLGVEHRMTWEPPFGYYDAEISK
ncbi:MAG TPA: gluconate 2-dehydrogenase subunit 3 family protein [Bryobacteraceae bacterium]|nr:gluconate 2-dehydrogenase subunit 3 family protein [Bryobacteraceae bacterium]